MEPRAEICCSLIPLMSCILLSLFVFYILINCYGFMKHCVLRSFMVGTLCQTDFLGNVRHVNH
jgi:hypothetical protein